MSSDEEDCLMRKIEGLLGKLAMRFGLALVGGVVAITASVVTGFWNLKQGQADVKRETTELLARSMSDRITGSDYDMAIFIAREKDGQFPMPYHAEIDAYRRKN